MIISCIYVYWLTIERRLLSIFFTRRPKVVIASVCVCEILLVRAITHHTFQLESHNLDEMMQNILLKIPID